jgi:hypothetical protein
MRAVLDQADVIFLDPDNGLGEASAKHATFSEIRLLRRSGRAIVFIKFPGREIHETQVSRLHEQLHEETGAERAVTI